MFTHTSAQGASATPDSVNGGLVGRLRGSFVSRLRGTAAVNTAAEGLAVREIVASGRQVWVLYGGGAAAERHCCRQHRIRGPGSAGDRRIGAAGECMGVDVWKEGSRRGRWV